MPAALANASIVASAVVAGLIASAALNLALDAALHVAPPARADRLTLSHVAEAAGWVSSYYATHRRTMPSSLREAAAASGVTPDEYASYVDDPATHSTMTYRRGAKSAYQLCVTFQEREAYPERFSIWNHERGARCFSLDASVQGSPATPRLDGEWWRGC